jgi:hypothetical protein
MIDASTLFQILGSLCVFIGYWLNAKNHPRQHQLFILGHIFLISFSIVEEKAVLIILSAFIIFMQYRASRKKYKFKKDMVRAKKVIRRIKVKEYENKGMSQKKHETAGIGY